MTAHEIAREELGADCPEEHLDYVLWNHTGYAGEDGGFWGGDPETTLRRQLREYREDQLLKEESTTTDYDVPRLETDKGDGETWEAYAHRLEKRIKEQRIALEQLQRIHANCPNRANRKRITNLEAALGRASLRGDRLNEAVKALAAKKA